MSKLKLESNSSGAGNITLKSPNTDSDRTLTLPDDNGTIVHQNASGDVGIGITSPVRRLHVSDDGVPPVRINRDTSDGSLVEFRKDNTDVGIISTNGGWLGIGYDNAILLDGSIRPFDITASSNNDNAMDLGRSYSRFKDLYLSGGIYVGGTGSANHLDDYEEGTFTPSFENSASIAAYETSYVKVGRIVQIHMFIQVTSASSDTSDLRINGLPFTCSSGNNQFDYGLQFRSRYANSSVNNIGVTAYINGAQNYVHVARSINSGTHASNKLSYDEIVGANSAEIYISGTYRTDS